MSNPKGIRLHFFRHVPFEEPAFIGDWASAKGCSVSETKFYEGNSMPSLSSIDWLVIMGGPMNVYEHKKYPWLKGEKDYIEKAVEAGKTVIGVCLGAQLIADVLGAGVFKADGNKYGFKEIGWFPVRFLRKNAPAFFADVLPAECTVFHWHGDTFDIPEGAVRLAESDGCKNEAFIYNDRVLALQFHMEMGKENILDIIENCRDDIKPGKYVKNYIQSADEMLKAAALYQENVRNVLYKMLDKLNEK